MRCEAAPYIQHPETPEKSAKHPKSCPIETKCGILDRNSVGQGVELRSVVVPWREECEK